MHGVREFADACALSRGEDVSPYPIPRGFCESLNVAIMRAAPPQRSMEQTFSAVRDFVRDLEREGHVHVVRGPRDMEKDGTKVVLRLEEPPLGAHVRALRQHNIRVMGIAAEGDNPFGSGWRNPRGCLTDQGRQLLRDMASYGMILDLAQAGWRTAEDALAFVLEIRRQGFSLPVMVSHTGCAAIYNHPRNLPDDVLLGVWKNANGVVGICTITYLLHGERDDLGIFFEHLDHALLILGTDAVVIGGHGPYMKELEAEQILRFRKMQSAKDGDGLLKARFPEHPVELDTSNRMQVLRERMSESYDSIVVHAVCRGNLSRFLMDCLGGY